MEDIITINIRQLEELFKDRNMQRNGKRQSITNYGKKTLSSKKKTKG